MVEPTCRAHPLCESPKQCFELSKYFLYLILPSLHAFLACNDFFFFFWFSVIIFHLSQFETFLSFIQLNHTHGDFHFEHRKDMH